MGEFEGKMVEKNMVAPLCAADKKRLQIESFVIYKDNLFERNFFAKGFCCVITVVGDLP